MKASLHGRLRVLKHASGSAPTVLTAPQINQYASVGQPISFTRGTYSGTVTGFSQQWLKSGVPIAGATGLTYTPVSGDNPSNISVKETALNGATPSADNISNGTVFATTAVFIGDSVTYGAQASVTANRWTSLYSTALGLTELNQGRSGTILQNVTYSASSPGTAQSGNGFDNFCSDMLASGHRRMRAVIAYGYNDARYTGGQGVDGTGTSVSLANYKSQLQRTVSGLICQGYRPGDIHIVSPYWMTDTGLNSGTTGYNMVTNLGSVSAARAQLIAFRDAAHDVALEYGCIYTDAYTALMNAGAGAVSGDNIHPNDTGHAAIAAAVEASGPLNSVNGCPTGISMARNGAGAALVSWKAAPAPTNGTTITGYTVEYGLKSAIAAASRFVMTGTVTAAANATSQGFTGLADGWYVCRVRAAYSDGTFSPWAWFTAGQNIDSRTTDTTTVYSDLTQATPGSNLETYSPWAKLASTASTTIGGAGSLTGFVAPEVIPPAASQTCIYKVGSQDFPGSGKLFGEQVWNYQSNTAGAINTSVLLKSNSASSGNGILALCNDTNIRVFKLTAGALATATGTTTYTVSLTAGLDYLVRLEVSSGAQTVYLNNVAVATATEPTGGSWGTEAGLRYSAGATAGADGVGVHVKSMRVGTTV